MLGDQDDMLRRLKAVLPTGWFPDDSPVADGLLVGSASIWSWAWSFLDYVARQRRISTATDINLEVIASDFLGDGVPRRPRETDTSYRARIKAAIFREMGTRKAVSNAIISVTGIAPSIFEPARATDTGGYGGLGISVGTGLGYGLAGGYGSYDLPFQAFIAAPRPGTGLGGNLQGYSSTTLAPLMRAIGGYGVGSIAYLLGSQDGHSASDDEVFAAVNAVRPIATVMWIALSNGSITNPNPSGPDLLDLNFILDVSRLS